MWNLLPPHTFHIALPLSCFTSRKAFFFFHLRHLLPYPLYSCYAKTFHTIISRVTETLHTGLIEGTVSLLRAGTYECFLEKIIWLTFSHTQLTRIGSISLKIWDDTRPTLVSLLEDIPNRFCSTVRDPPRIKTKTCWHHGTCSKPTEVALNSNTVGRVTCTEVVGRERHTEITGRAKANTSQHLVSIPRRVLSNMADCTAGEGLG